MKGVQYFLLLLLWFFSESPVVAEVDAIFSPGGNIKEALLQEIDSTISTLDLAIPEVNSIELANALVRAKQRGVKVRIVADSKQAKMKSSRITFLIHQGIPVKVLGGKERGAMNHRFAILDGKKVLTGSLDWLEASAKWNYENLLVIQSSETASSFQKEFDWLWREKRIIR